MSELQLTGRLFKIFPEQKGTSKSGKDWKKKDFCIETEEQYSKKICFTLFSDKVSYIDNFVIGDMIDVKFNVESNEFNGRYFTNINAYSIQKSSGNVNIQSTGTTKDYSSSVIKTNEMSIKDQIMERKANEPEIEDSDLPF